MSDDELKEIDELLELGEQLKEKVKAIPSY